jgi:WD40 repeat protein
LHSPKPNRHDDRHIAFAPDWQRWAFVNSGHDGILVRDLTARQDVVTLKFAQGSDRRVCGEIAWSPDGARLAAAIGSLGKGWPIKIWRVADGKELVTCRGHLDTVTPLAWSPDGRRLASGGRDGTVRIWDTAIGMELLALPGPSSGAHSLAWSPDGKRLAAGGENGAIKVWDAGKRGR